MLKLFKFLKPIWWSVLIVVCLVVAKTLIDLFVPNLTSEVIKLIPSTNPITGELINADGSIAVKSEIIPKMIKAGLLALSAVFGVIVIEIFASISGSFMASRFSGNVRKNIYTKIQNLSVEDINDVGVSSLISRTTSDIGQIQQFMAMAFRLFVSAPITFIGGLILTLDVNKKLGIVLLCGLPAILVLIIVIATLIVPLFNRMQKRTDALTLVSRENLSGVRIIRAFNADEISTQKFSEKNKELTQTATKANKIMGFAFPLVNLIFSLIILGIVLVFSLNLKNTNIIDLNVFANLQKTIQYSMKIMMSFMMLVMMFIMLPRAMVSAKRINQVLGINSKIKNGTKICEDTKITNLEFKNVTFKYDGAEAAALSDISFSAKSGETLAIIGGTGSGKSTIINLICRFLDASGGEILLNGENIKDLTLESLHKKIGYVPQKAVLFNASVRENITLGNESITDEQIINASEIACAKDFILKKGGGFSAHISDKGGNLSGGQKQRIAIARAIAKAPKILLFDDSFSALDFKTDKKVRDALKKHLKNVLTIVVAQRVNVIMNADRIIVLDDGKVVGTGTHNELVKNCVLYKQICDSQAVEG